MSPPEVPKKEMIKELKVEWKYARDYRVVPANGMWGGLTPRGDLRVEFFVEFLEFPKTTLILNEVNGKYDERRDGRKNERLKREIQIGMSIPVQQVASFSEWFKGKAQEIEAANLALQKKLKG